MPRLPIAAAQFARSIHSTLPLRPPHTQAHEDYCDAADAFKIKPSEVANKRDLLKKGYIIATSRKIVKAYVYGNGDDWSLRQSMIKAQSELKTHRILPTDLHPMVLATYRRGFEMK